jgi:hypothetical protein
MTGQRSSFKKKSPVLLRRVAVTAVVHGNFSRVSNLPVLWRKINSQKILASPFNYRESVLHKST